MFSAQVESLNRVISIKRSRGIQRSLVQELALALNIKNKILDVATKNNFFEGTFGFLRSQEFQKYQMLTSPLSSGPTSAILYPEA